MPAIVVNYAMDRQAGGKFVVLSPVGDGAGLVLFSNFFIHTQHAYIVRHWEQAVQSSVGEAGFRVSGGGWWKIIANNCLKLHGSSAAYGSFDHDWITKNLRPGRVFGEESILVE